MEYKALKKKVSKMVDRYSTLSVLALCFIVSILYVLSDNNFIVAGYKSQIIESSPNSGNSLQINTPTKAPTLTPTPTTVVSQPLKPTLPPLHDCGSGHLVTDLSQCGTLNSQPQNNNSTKEINIEFEEAKINAKSIEAKLCREEALRNSENCGNECLGSSSEGRSYCRSVLETRNLSIDEYSQCLDANSNIFDACSASCTENFENELKSCEPKF